MMMSLKTFYVAPDFFVFASGAETLLCVSDEQCGIETLNDNVHDLSGIWTETE